MNKLIILCISMIILIGWTSPILGNESDTIIIKERIDGPANVRDAPNGSILFSLNDNITVECTELKNDWYMVGLYVRVDSVQHSTFSFNQGDTLYDSDDGLIMGIIKSKINIRMSGKHNGVRFGFIAGYTHKNNIKPESIIENVIAETINNANNEITASDLDYIINSFSLMKCSSKSMGDDNGNWFFTWGNSIDDPSPRDRITLIVEDNLLLAIVHAREIQFKKHKTYELIRGHKLTLISDLNDSDINKIISERKEWYNSID